MMMRARDAVLPLLLGIGLLAGGGSTLGMAMDGWLSGLGAASLVALSAAHLAGWRPMASAWRIAAALAGALLLLVLVQLVPLGPDGLGGNARESARWISSEFALPLAGTLSLDPDATERFAIHWLLPLSILFAALGARETERQRALDAIIVIALFNALLATAQRLGGPEWLAPWGTLPGSAGGLFANANHLGLLIAVAMLLAFARLSDRPLALLVTGLLLALGSVASGSRAAVVLMTLAILAPLVIQLVLATKRKTARASRRLVAAGAALLVAALILSQVLADPRGDWLEGLASEQRLAFWPSLAALAGNAWPWGVGFGAMGATYRVTQPLDAVGPAFVNEAHNEPLQWVIEGGLAGAVLLVVTLAAVSGAAIRAAKRKDGSQIGVIALALFLVGLHSLVDYPMRSVAAACLAATLVGAILPTPSPRRTERRGRHAAWLALLVAPFVGLAATLPLRAAALAQDDPRRALALRDGQADALSQRAEDALLAGDTAEAIAFARASLARKPVNPDAVRNLLLARELSGEIGDWREIGKMGWRDVASHVVGFYKARARADMAAMARHAEAVLRRGGGDPQLVRDIRVAANDSRFARALFEREEEADFLARLWQVEGDASEAEVSGAAALAQIAPQALDPTTLGFVLYRLVERGRHDDARALYLRSDPPPPLAAERADERVRRRPASPFVWRLTQDRDTRASMDGASLVVRGGVATRGEVASKWLALERGRYRLQGRAKMTQGTGRMTVTLTCPDGSELVRGTSDQEGTVRLIDFTLNDACPMPLVRIEAQPDDRRFVARLLLSMRRVDR